jgi:hypothetical protein
MRDEHESKKVTGAPDVLTDHEIRRVFPIIEPTRHAERNRLAFVPSIYSGLRVEFIDENGGGAGGAT